MNNRAEIIRRLQGLIAIEEAQKAILEESGLYGSARQVLLDNMKRKLEYEKELELRELKRPVIATPLKKSWQENIWLYIAIGVLILVIAALIIRLVNL